MIELMVENVKCQGCVNTLQKRLGALAGVQSVQVDVEHGCVTIDAAEALRPNIEQLLCRLGYPVVGTTSGLSAIGADVRSVIACAVGKLQRE